MKSVMYVLLALIGLCSCNHAMNCPTTNPKYFYKPAGVRKAAGKSLYRTPKGKNTNNAFVVPAKYRKGISNYGKLK
jgi:hypothetical protein